MNVDKALKKGMADKDIEIASLINNLKNLKSEFTTFMKKAEIKEEEEAKKEQVRQALVAD